MLSLPLSFYVFLNFLIPPPCLLVSFLFPKCHSQYSFSCFFSISAVLSHSSSSSSLPPKILVTSCLNASCFLQFSPLYLWLYFLCFFFFTIRTILHTTIWCCFATHSFNITLQSHISFKFLLPIT